MSFDTSSLCVLDHVKRPCLRLTYPRNKPTSWCFQDFDDSCWLRVLLSMRFESIIHHPCTATIRAVCVLQASDEMQAGDLYTNKSQTGNLHCNLRMATCIATCASQAASQAASQPAWQPAHGNLHGNLHRILNSNCRLAKCPIKVLRTDYVHSDPFGMKCFQLQWCLNALFS